MRRTSVGCKLRGRGVKTLGGLEHLIDERGTTAVSAAWVWDTMLPCFFALVVINRCLQQAGLLSDPAWARGDRVLPAGPDFSGGHH